MIHIKTIFLLVNICSERGDFTEQEDSGAEQEDLTNIEALRQSWHNEKLALLDSIQGLKDILAQTANQPSVSNIVSTCLIENHKLQDSSPHSFR